MERCAHGIRAAKSRWRIGVFSDAVDVLQCLDTVICKELCRRLRCHGASGRMSKTSATMKVVAGSCQDIICHSGRHRRRWHYLYVEFLVSSAGLEFRGLFGNVQDFTNAGRPICYVRLF